MKYVVIDTNVLVSALITRNEFSPTVQILHFIAAVEEKMRDPKDVVFYAVTLSSQDKNSLLVTGNGKHFPQKPFIVTPAELVAILRGEK